MNITINYTQAGAHLHSWETSLANTDILSIQEAVFATGLVNPFQVVSFVAEDDEGNTLLLGTIPVDEAGGESAEDEEHVKSVNVEFDIVSGRAAQTIELNDPDINEDMLIEGLENYTYLTTMGFGDGSQVIETKTQRVIGIVIDQSVEAEYEDFE